MDNRLMETLETIEEKIEHIKWLIVTPFSFKRKGISVASVLIRKTAGILGKSFPRGTAFENKLRKTWKTSVLRRER